MGYHKLASFFQCDQRVLLSAVLLLGFAAVNQVAYKKMTNTMPNYMLFLCQLVNSVYIPTSGAWTLYDYYSGNYSDEVHSFRSRDMMMMGLLDGIAGVLSMIGAVRTSGRMQVILSQVSIPLSTLFDIVLLKKTFHPSQIVGAGLVLVGAIEAQLSGSSDNQGEDALAFNLLFAAGALPGVLSNFYKELAFSNVELPLSYMLFWSNLYATIAAFFFLPLQSLPILGAQSVPITNIPQAMIRGWYCFWYGENFVTVNCGNDGEITCDKCEYGFSSVVTYCAVNILFNIVMMAVLKHGGALVFVLVMTLQIPLCTFLFSSPAIMGNDAQRGSLSAIVAILLILVGISAFRYKPLYDSATKSATDEMPQPLLTITRGQPTLAGIRWFTVGLDPTMSRSAHENRSRLLWRLDIASPLESPLLRKKSHSLSVICNNTVPCPKRSVRAFSSSSICSYGDTPRTPFNESLSQHTNNTEQANDDDPYRRRNRIRRLSTAQSSISSTFGNSNSSGGIPKAPPIAQIRGACVSSR